MLAFVVHHICGRRLLDGPADPRRDDRLLRARTTGQAPAWTPLPVQYADYALWQREVLGAEDDPESLIAQQIDYWTDALAGLPDQLDLPADRPRPAVASGRGAHASLRRSTPKLHAGCSNQVARTQNATLFMVVHAALAVLLARLSGDHRHRDRHAGRRPR